ncbi:uncharacterized protein FFB20_08596 [Fusarium fujikuroi]|nr:uncharacterized protein FFB20_08596 [Fusarium fujikuroi]SCN99917.1 uncharacterized protein FFC1_08307 [Fusarium fujikuroi]
MPYITSSFF